MKLARIVWHAVLALLLLGVLPVRAADSPYTLYAIVSLTGPAAFLGRGEASTLAVVEKYINATGGIKGQPIHFVVEDDTSTPTVAVQLVNELIAKKVPAFVGPGFGATCTALLALLDNGPVMYCMANSIHPPPGSYIFSYSPSTTEIAATSFRYLMAKGVRKIGLLATTDASGQDGELIVAEDLKRPEFKDLQLVANEHMAVNDLSVDAQIQRLKASGAQAITAWVTGTPYGTVLRSIQNVGYDGIVMTTGANQNKTQMTQYDAFIPRDQILIGQPYSAVGRDVPPPVQRAKTIFLDQMKQAGYAVPDATQWIAWDPAMIVIDAIRSIGPTATARQVRDHILQLHNFPGVNGYYDFRHGDQRGIDPRSNVVVRWDIRAADFVTISRPGGTPL